MMYKDIEEIAQRMFCTIDSPQILYLLEIGGYLQICEYEPQLKMWLHPEIIITNPDESIITNIEIRRNGLPTDISYRLTGTTTKTTFDKHFIEAEAGDFIGIFAAVNRPNQSRNTKQENK